MKKISAFAATLFIASTFCFAQSKPLNGSGKTITKTFAYKQFDKIDLQGLNGKANITIGKPFSISVTIDDNLAALIAVKEDDGKLSIKLTGNENNRLYLEKNKISINITMPEISVLQNSTNCEVIIDDVVGRYFRIENFSNGDITITGTIDELDIIKEGNGNINAASLVAQTATAKVNGNGDVTLTATQSFSVSGSGNGNVNNTGKGILNSGSDIKGNGEIIINAAQ